MVRLRRRPLRYHHHHRCIIIRLHLDPSTRFLRHRLITGQFGWEDAIIVGMAVGVGGMAIIGTGEESTLSDKDGCAPQFVKSLPQ